MIDKKSLLTRNLIFKFYCLLLIAFFVVDLLLPSYLNFSASTVISFPVTDGWCNAVTQGIGKHCFGDYYYAARFANMSHPWSGSLYPYPPLAAAMFKPFIWISSFSKNPRLGLLIYLLFIIVAVAGTFRLMLKNRYKGALNDWRMEKNAFIALGAISAPILIVFDRGNNTAFLFPLFWLYVKFWKDSNSIKSLFLLMIMVLIKPQMILLGLLLIRNRKDVVNGLKFVVIAMLTFLASFLLYPKGLVKNVLDFAHQESVFQSHPSPGYLFPQNLSLCNLIGLIARISGYRITSSLAISGIELLFLVIFTAIYFAYRNRRQENTNLLLITSMPLLIPAVCYSYYYVLLLIPLYYVFLESKYVSELFYRKWWSVSFGLMLVFVFIPFAVPWRLFLRNHGSSAFLNSGIFSLLGQIMFDFVSLICLVMIPIMENRSSNTNRGKSTLEANI